MILKHTRELNIPSLIDSAVTSLLRKIRADAHDEFMDIDNKFSSVYGQFTGFVNQDEVVVSYDSTTKKITLTGNFTAYYRMKTVRELVSGWVSPALTSTTTASYLYYDGTSFLWSTTFPGFYVLLIAYTYYRADGTFVFANRECHGMMPNSVHEEMHHTLKTYKYSGGTLGSYVIDSTTEANRRPDVGITVIADEDLKTTNAALSSKLYSHTYLQSSGAVTSTTDNAEIVPVSGARPYVNSYSGGVWTQTPISNNNYMSVWVIAMPTTADTVSQKRRFIFMQGQQEGTLESQQSLMPSSLNLDGLINIINEAVFVAKIIIRYTASNWSISEINYLEGYLNSQISAPTDASQYVGIENDVINGDLSMWQVGTSLPAGTGSRYLADMMRNGSSGTTIAPSRQDHTAGSEIDGCKYYFRNVVSSVSGVANYGVLSIVFDEETLRKHAGKTVTLSFSAKADATKNIATEYVQGFGSGGSPSAAVEGIGVTTHTLSTAWTQKTCTFNVPSIAGKTFGTTGGSAYGLVILWFDSGSNYNTRNNSLGQQSGTFDISTIQLTVSDVALPFIHRDKNETRRICESYYRVLPAIVWSGYAATSGGNTSTISGLSMRLPINSAQVTLSEGGSGQSNFPAGAPFFGGTVSNCIVMVHKVALSNAAGYYYYNATIDQRN